MRERAIGDIKVGSIGLGAMPLSIEGRPDEERAIATVHAALDAGVTLLDTADSYHRPGAEPGHNELLVARALTGRAEDVLVATKGGRGRHAGRTGAGAAGRSVSPELRDRRFRAARGSRRGRCGCAGGC